jgi:uncharacterized protein YabN with tetrapyrrole methylase and pyrophosphatase domain
MKKKSAIKDLLKVMAKLRSPSGCPWDREQTPMSLRRHAIEEVYELIDAIESRDDHEMAEELGDLLLQVVFHCQMADERGAFDFEKVTRHLVDKLVRRHPHVFGKTKVKNVDEVWANWEKIKRAEKHGTKRARHSALDGIPKHLPALLRAEKLVKRRTKQNYLRTANHVGFLKKTLWQNNFSRWRNSHRRAAGVRKNCCAKKSKELKNNCGGASRRVCRNNFIQRIGFFAKANSSTIFPPIRCS